MSMIVGNLPVFRGVLPFKDWRYRRRPAEYLPADRWLHALGLTPPERGRALDRLCQRGFGYSIATRTI
jgi:hypothetical protein